MLLYDTTTTRSDTSTNVTNNANPGPIDLLQKSRTRHVQSSLWFLIPNPVRKFRKFAIALSLRDLPPIKFFG